MLPATVRWGSQSTEEKAEIKLCDHIKALTIYLSKTETEKKHFRLNPKVQPTAQRTRSTAWTLK